MRVILLLVLIAAVLASGAVYFARLDAGYVLLAWGDYAVEMTAWVFAVSLALVWFGVWFVSALIRYALGFQLRLGRWFGARGIGQIHNMTARGLAAFEEGHWQRARKLLAKVADQSDNAVVFYLLCARASHALDDADSVSLYLQKAENVAPNASMAISLTQAQLQLSDGSLEACLATLKRAQAINEAHPTVLKMLTQVYTGLNDWQSLDALLPMLQSEQVLTKGEFDALRYRCKCELLEQASKQGLDAVMAVWKRQLSSVRQQQAMVAVYARCLVQHQATKMADSVLRTSLQERVDDQLLHIYARLDGIAPEQRLQFVAGLLKKGESSAGLLLCAGELAKLCKLPSQATQYIEQAYHKQPTAATRLALVSVYLEAQELAKALALLRTATD